MPLPMVHLAIAIGLEERTGTFPSPAFLLGSIAPDSIHMRPNAAPGSKDVTHLMKPPDTPDHACVWEMVERYRDTPLKAFAAGYAAHILTDRFWERTVIEQFRQSIPPDMDDAARRNLYYRETDQADLHLYQHMSWRPQVWENLEQADSPDFAPLLSSEEIHLWRERTLRWFEDPAHNPGITPQYFSETLVGQFIENAVNRIAADFLLREIADG